ncbi:hypothetical protein OG870_04495 [Streptomyces sp. NBC_00461]|uniref:hypothetical protein n=1 Tax=Streptomyces sp. NBC_00461 TaxID=2975750 RepID=UPI002E181393
MLDTLADPAAPWRKQQHPTASAAAGSPEKRPKPTRNTPGTGGSIRGGQALAGYTTSADGTGARTRAVFERDHIEPGSTSPPWTLPQATRTVKKQSG